LSKSGSKFPNKIFIAKFEESKRERERAVANKENVLYLKIVKKFNCQRKLLVSISLDTPSRFPNHTIEDTYKKEKENRP
jgi:hypothetical protein